MRNRILTRNLHDAIVSVPSGLISSVRPKGVYRFDCSGPIAGKESEVQYLRSLLPKYIDNEDYDSVYKINEAIQNCLELKWSDQIINGTPDTALDDMLDKYWSGASYTAAWYMGLVSATGYTTGFAAGDTSASHAGWAEDVNYTQTTRPAITFDAASSGSKSSASASVFSMNATTTIKGGFVIGDNTKSGTTGILASTGLFLTGDKAVGNGYTINASFIASMAEAP